MGMTILTTWFPSLKKKLPIFLSPTGMSLTKLSLAGNTLIVPGKGEFG
jgi:hypothetical protein